MSKFLKKKSMQWQFVKGNSDALINPVNEKQQASCATEKNRLVILR